MLAMYLKYHKAGLTPTTPVTSIAISPVKMSIGHKSLTNLHSEMITKSTNLQIHEMVILTTPRKLIPTKKSTFTVNRLMGSQPSPLDN
jgi:hypothetical protein